METLFIVIGILFIVAGIIGAFLPVVPGPPLSYVGLLILHFTKGDVFSWVFLAFWFVVSALVITLDTFVPAEGARRMGGSKNGIYGALIGGLAGLIFFPPAGIILGPIVGAFIGELLTGSDSKSVLRAVMGTFIGYLITIVIKAGTAIIMAYYFFTNM